MLVPVAKPVRASVVEGRVEDGFVDDGFVEVWAVEVGIVDGCGGVGGIGVELDTAVET